ELPASLLQRDSFNPLTEANVIGIARNGQQRAESATGRLEAQRPGGVQRLAGGVGRDFQSPVRIGRRNRVMWATAVARPRIETALILVAQSKSVTAPEVLLLLG